MDEKNKKTFKSYEYKTNSEILHRLDAYRAIEVNNLWQRSVFLATFLVLGYTGYGFLLGKMIDTNESHLDLLHFLACALACVNIIFSALWIAMAKGSKAWYEVYENAIVFVENSDREKFSWKEIRCEIDLRKRKYSSKCVDKGFKCSDRNNQCVFENSKNDCLFSTKAGGYSPSKINIALGQISLIIWFIVLVVHLVILIFAPSEMEGKGYLALILILITFIIYFVLIHTRWIKSSYFRD